MMVCVGMLGASSVAPTSLFTSSAPENCSSSFISGVHIAACDRCTCKIALSALQDPLRIAHIQVFQCPNKRWIALDSIFKASAVTSHSKAVPKLFLLFT